MVVGSFLNVCIHRLPRGESIIFPASHCPQCQHQLAPLDLIPILSFVLLKGRCRYCQAKISVRYPLVELLTGLLFVLAGYFFPLERSLLTLIFSLIFISFLLVAAFIDWSELVIPDVISYSGIVLGLFYNWLTGNIFNAILGMALGYGFIWLIARLGRVVFKKEAMGEGDLYLAAFIGAFLGWELMAAAFFLSYLFAGVAAVVFLLLGRVKMGQPVPFGPALAVGAIAALFWGTRLINWYVGFLV
jgi:leader peptidase (prepilin peptidase)/N-methyltransferase